MDDYPKMLYRYPATGANSLLLEGANYDTRIVISADDEEQATADAWRATWTESLQEARAAQAAADAQAADAARAAALAADNAAPTRAELEQKARELNIGFDGRTSDKKLSDLIRATLET